MAQSDGSAERVADGAASGGSTGKRDKRKRYEPQAKKNVNATAFEIWFEEAWHGWLRLTSLAAGIGLIALLYSLDVLSERFVATLIAVALIGLPLGYVAQDLWRRTEGRTVLWRVVAVAFIGIWAFGAGYPAGCAVIPPHQADAKTLVRGQTIHLDASKISGPIELLVRGSVQGSGDADGKITLHVESNGIGEDATGEIGRHSSFMRVGRHGSGRVTTEKNADTVVFDHVKASKDVAVSVAYADPIVNPQIEVAVQPRPFPLRLFVWLGIGLLLLGMFLDGRLADRDSSYAAMWVSGTMIFAVTLWQYSDPSNIVRPAIGALLTAGFVGLSGGAFASWLGDRLFRPSHIKRRKR